MQRVAVINAVGLSPSLLGASTPRLNAFRQKGQMAAITPAFPAVTCTAQSNYLTGQPPARHGIVGNGWFDRDLAEVHFWKQSDHLVQTPKIWEDLRKIDGHFTCAKLFWWYNMYSSVDYSITPRPMYPADGRKFFDIYTWPFPMRAEIKQDLGEFPFATFWGPAAGVPSPQGPPDAASRWIAESAKWIETRHQPTLSLVYLPHLDYTFQRLGPEDPAVARDVQALDGIVGDLIAFFQQRGVRVVVLSEYGLVSVRHAIHLNRLFRKQGWVAIKEELGLEMLDCGASKVFAVADHQIAHVYLNDPSLIKSVRSLLESQPGIAEVLAKNEPGGINHPRAGDLIAVAMEQAWFTYYYWLDDSRAPDFARCVDIHRKPGYDPVELFLDPNLRFPKLKIAWRLLQKKLGFRMLMDVIPLEASLVKGSHGLKPASVSEYPILIAEKGLEGGAKLIDSTQVYDVLKQQVLG
jgi:predicted AlkP superfamily pyrophosphatase or phosphodiesterase